MKSERAIDRWFGMMQKKKIFRSVTFSPRVRIYYLQTERFSARGHALHGAHDE